MEHRVAEMAATQVRLRQPGTDTRQYSARRIQVPIERRTPVTADRQHIRTAELYRTPTGPPEQVVLSRTQGYGHSLMDMACGQCATGSHRHVYIVLRRLPPIRPQDDEKRASLQRPPVAHSQHKQGIHLAVRHCQAHAYQHNPGRQTVLYSPVTLFRILLCDSRRL